MRRAGGVVMAPGVRETLAMLQDFVPSDDAHAVASLQATIALLGNGPVAFDRTHYDPGHVTASGLVLSRGAEAVLLVHHPRLGRWLQPGGHVERDDASVVSAAKREVLEETGIELNDRTSALVAVDVHQIPAAAREPAHRHHDLMFAFVTDRAVPSGADARWWAVEEVRALPGDPAVLRGLAHALGTLSAKGGST